MQFDMHYYGTFAAAWAAGLSSEDSHVIATSAQLVDDNNLSRLHTLSSGQGVLGVATAHHPLDAGTRVLSGGTTDDCRLIWVPFHFLPGGLGHEFEQRVICVKDSPVARRMVDYYTDPTTITAHRGHSLQLMGIAAHVYADTFSHYGFSGISSRLNEVDPSSIQIDERHDAGILSYLKDKAERFAASFADAVRLGHGAVATYPDRPYLRWSYRTNSGDVVRRNNPATFLEAFAALHAMFDRYRATYYDGGGTLRVRLLEIEAAVREVLAVEAAAEQRAAKWRQVLAEGRLGEPVAAPEYSATAWLDELKALQNLEYDAAGDSVSSNGYNFFVAADYHRNYVLKRLLPTAGLFVA